MNTTYSSLFGLKHNPFLPSVPTESLHVTQKLEMFCWRLERLVADGGFALITGDVGHGKSCALRIVDSRLSKMRDVTVGVVSHPQCRVTDFYRQMGDIFGVTLAPSNRWGSFRSLREKWQAHIDSSFQRPVLLIDEAQEMQPVVLNELRILSQAKFDQHNVLTVCFAGDQRLPDKLQTPDLMPLATRIKCRLTLDYSTAPQLRDALTHALQAAGAPHLMTSGLIDTMCERAAGNMRVLFNLAADLLDQAAKQERTQLDEALFLEVFDIPRTGPRRQSAKGSSKSSTPQVQR